VQGHGPPPPTDQRAGGLPRERHHRDTDSLQEITARARAATCRGGLHNSYEVFTHRHGYDNYESKNYYDINACTIFRGKSSGSIKDKIGAMDSGDQGARWGNDPEGDTSTGSDSGTDESLNRAAHSGGGWGRDDIADSAHEDDDTDDTAERGRDDIFVHEHEHGDTSDRAGHSGSQNRRSCRLPSGRRRGRRGEQL